MALTKDEEQFISACTTLDTFSPIKSKSVCDAHGQIQTAKTISGYGLGRLLKTTLNTFGVLIKEDTIDMCVPKKRSNEVEHYPFFFYVDNIKNAMKDSAESLHFYLCVCLEKGWTVLRQTRFDVSPLALLPYHYEYTPENEPTQKYHIGLKLTIPEFSTTEYASKEATIDYLTKVVSLKLKCKFSNAPYDSQWSDGQYRQETVCLAEFEQINVPIIDDYGFIFDSFASDAKISSEELPEGLTDTTYSLDQETIVAPLTTDKPLYCVLYTGKRNTVMVLRWLPTQHSEIHDKPILQLKTLGSITPEQNETLYSTMAESGNNILFAKMERGTINIICNMSGYYDSELRNFVLPVDLFNLAK
ncbi:MAG: hypothetical protein J5663_09620 [Bacteroidaceae bacterium]|nr:hypothetical protein [Bacteroidaceae bacterium]